MHSKREQALGYSSVIHDLPRIRKKELQGGKELIPVNIWLMMLMTGSSSQDNLREDRARANATGTRMAIKTKKLPKRRIRVHLQFPPGKACNF